MNEVRHKVTIRSGKEGIENWTSYEITCDMLEAADGFTIAIGPVDPVGERFGTAWAAVAPDSPVQVLLDDVAIMTGFIDDREGTSSMNGDVLTVSGRDRASRLIDESMDLISFTGLDLEKLALKIASPWFERIAFSNAENRSLVRGAARGAKGGRAFKEPNVPRSARAYRKVEPGESRWAVLDYFLRELELLAWPSGDGKTLIIGAPNYDQEPTFRLFHARAGSVRAAESNVMQFKVKDSVGERYSQITAFGSQTGDDGSVQRGARGTATNGPGLLGVGADFQARKTLIITDDNVRGTAQAQVRARREMAQRDANGHEITVTVPGHAQQIDGARSPTLYACDNMVDVESEVFGIKGRYLITQTTFRRDESSGETTDLRLVPKGTRLQA